MRLVKLRIAGSMKKIIYIKNKIKKFLNTATGQLKEATKNTCLSY